MNRIGLALSGGGFRAIIYHLGVVRFLRDAGLLPSVSHITSVSGGSILAAHLVLNWQRYNGSAKDFEGAAAEIIRFAGLDIRNRILRRYPFGAMVNWSRRFAGMKRNRLLTRTGLLECHYRDHLYGDKCLFELPATPELHVLTTNLSEGQLCSFTREGLVFLRRTPEHGVRLDLVPAGLATIPMAVTASSAFPGLFPPLELQSSDVGATEGDFGRQFFTDGGVFDNLGIRMFRCIEESWLSRHTTPPRPPEEAGGEGSRSDGNTFDQIIISDAGKTLQRVRKARFGGLIGTAIRASDILMDRVWQLENETFQSTPGCTFVPIRTVIGVEEDATAPHPEIQRQVTHVRTDLDRFSSLEISALARHGYCVARSVYRSFTGLEEGGLAAGAPWDPVDRPSSTGTEARGTPGGVVGEARELQGASQRGLLGSFFDPSDWVSYLYVPLVLLVVFALPYYLYHLQQKAQVSSMIIAAVADSSPDNRKVLELLDRPSVERFLPMEYEEVPSLGEAPSYEGFDFLVDTKIVDMRRWLSDVPPSDPRAPPRFYIYRRFRVQKTNAHDGKRLLRLQFPTRTKEIDFRCTPARFDPKGRLLRRQDPIAGHSLYVYEIELDLNRVPLNEPVDIIIEAVDRPELAVPRAFHQEAESALFAETGIASMWILLPTGQSYGSYQVIRYETGKLETMQRIEPAEKIVVHDGSIIGWQIAHPKLNHTYGCRWTHIE